MIKVYVKRPGEKTKQFLADDDTFKVSNFMDRYFPGEENYKVDGIDRNGIDELCDGDLITIEREPEDDERADEIVNEDDDTDDDGDHDDDDDKAFVTNVNSKRKETQTERAPEQKLRIEFYVPARAPFSVNVPSGKTLRSILVTIRDKFDYYLNPKDYSIYDMNDNKYYDNDIISNDTSFIITKDSSGAI